MKRSALALVLVVALGAWDVGLRVTNAQAPDAASDHVVVISLDGFPGGALDDPDLAVPTLRRLRAAGASARVFRPVNPTVTWANHTSMVTGVRPARHGVIFNGLLVREPGLAPRVEPWRDKAEMVRVPTLYDVAHRAGLSTAQVDWVAVWNAPTISWEFRERPAATESIPQEMIGLGLVREADVASFGTKHIVWRDEAWTTAAVHILRRHRPNLALFHLLNLDSTHHRYGPRTHAALTAMAHLDAQVGRIVRAVDEAGMASRTTFFVVSDHGFKTVKRQIRPNVAFAEAGLISVSGGIVTRAEAYSVPEGGTAIVYVTEPDADGAILAKTRRALDGIEGIEQIVEPDAFAGYGLPHPEESDQMGRLLLVARDGYAFTAAAEGPAVVDAPATSLGAHGYLASDPDMAALFIAAGRGIASGVILDEVSTLDLAPTAAHLLGVALPDVEGRVLTEILR